MKKRNVKNPSRQKLIKKHLGIFKMSWCTFQILGGCQGRRTGVGGDNSIQFINFERVGDKSFEKWRQKIGAGGLEGWVTTIF